MSARRVRRVCGPVRCRRPRGASAHSTACNPRRANVNAWPRRVAVSRSQRDRGPVAPSGRPRSMPRPSSSAVEHGVPGGSGTTPGSSASGGWTRSAGWSWSAGRSWSADRLRSAGSARPPDRSRSPVRRVQRVGRVRRVGRARRVGPVGGLDPFRGVVAVAGPGLAGEPAHATRHGRYHRRRGHQAVRAVAVAAQSAPQPVPQVTSARSSNPPMWAPNSCTAASAPAPRTSGQGQAGGPR